MQINPSDIELLKATPEKLKDLNFNCGDDDLNEFLLKDSFDNLKNNLSVIYLLKYKYEYIAYFSLSADSIRINEDLEVNYSYYPAVKIGRLAVSEKYQNKQVGTIIIWWIKAFCLTIRNNLGIRFISVDAYNNERTITFYKKNLFTELNCKRTISIPMYLDLNLFNNNKNF